MPAIGDIYECTIMGSQHAQATRIVRHVRVTAISGYASTEEGLLAAQIATWLDAACGALKTVLSNEASVNAAKAQRVWPAPRTYGAIAATSAGVGAVSSNALPTAVAAVARLRTGFAGRKFRGRMYIYGVPASYELDSQLTAGAVANYAGWAGLFVGTNNLTTGGRTVSIQNIIYHKGDHSWDAITSTDVDPVLRSQRRRQVGKGA